MSFPCLCLSSCPSHKYLQGWRLNKMPANRKRTYFIRWTLRRKNAGCHTVDEVTSPYAGCGEGLTTHVRPAGQKDRPEGPRGQRGCREGGLRRGGLPNPSTGARTRPLRERGGRRCLQLGERGGGAGPPRGRALYMAGRRQERNLSRKTPPKAASTCTKGRKAGGSRIRHRAISNSKENKPDL